MPLSKNKYLAKKKKTKTKPSEAQRKIFPRISFEMTFQPCLGHISSL